MSVFQKLADACGPQTRDMEIQVGEEKSTFTFRRLTAGEMDRLRASVADEEGRAKWRSRLISACLSKEGQVFDEQEIGSLPDYLVKKLEEAAGEVNGIGKAAEKAIQKNSVATSSDGSSSTSA